MNRLLGALFALVIACTAPAKADTIKLVVPFVAGGPTDMFARLLAQDMQPRLNADIVARAPADGKTLLFATLGSHVISAALRPQLSYDPVKSFTPIAFLGSVSS